MNDSEYEYDDEPSYVMPAADTAMSDAAAWPDPSMYSRERLYSPLVVLTGVFGALGVLGPLAALAALRRSRDRGMVQMSIVLTCFCCWIFWVSVYVAQMNPLIPPELANVTLIWISEKYGKKLVFPG